MIDTNLYYKALEADNAFSKACKDAGYKDRWTLPNNKSEWPNVLLEVYYTKIQLDSEWIESMRSNA